MNTKKTIDANSEESWEVSLIYANKLSYLPDRIHFAIRALRRHHLEQQGSDTFKISAAAYAAIRLIDKTRTFRTPLYFAAMKLFPQKFSEVEDDTTKALLKILGPGFFSTLLALVWFYGRIGKLSKSPLKEALLNEILTNAELGYLLSDLIPDLDPADGVLIGSIRHVAFGTFLIRDKELYKKHRNNPTDNFNSEFQFSRWGCDTAQVATYLLHLFGFIRSTLDIHNTNESPTRLRMALRGQYEPKPTEDKTLKAWALLTKVLDQIEKNGENLSFLTKMGMPEDVVAKTTASIEKVLTKGSSFTWLKRDYTPSIEDFMEPELEFEETIQGVTEEPLPHIEKDVAADLDALKKAGFSEEELADLSDEELIQLLEFSESFD